MVEYPSANINYQNKYILENKMFQAKQLEVKGSFLCHLQLFWSGKLIVVTIMKSELIRI